MQEKKFPRSAILALVTVFLLLCLTACSGNTDSSTAETSVAEGIAYLHSLEGDGAIADSALTEAPAAEETEAPAADSSEEAVSYAEETVEPESAVEQ